MTELTHEEQIDLEWPARDAAALGDESRVDEIDEAWGDHTSPLQLTAVELLRGLEIDTLGVGGYDVQGDPLPGDVLPRPPDDSTRSEHLGEIGMINVTTRSNLW